MNRGRTNQSRGRAGELLAAEYLLHKGLTILVRNYRYDQGEIDLICEDGEELVFVEVKTRTSKVFGDPEEAVTESKQEQLRKVAEGYCQEFCLDDKFYRFDIVTVMIEGEKSTVHHLPDAF
ncbi:MAG TPA: YraN family protein [Bacteroidota bacterium]|nr:YraN family protein [Bacteroidota bacterium]